MFFFFFKFKNKLKLKINHFCCSRLWVVQTGGHCRLTRETSIRFGQAQLQELLVLGSIKILRDFRGTLSIRDLRFVIDEKWIKILHVNASFFWLARLAGDKCFIVHVIYIEMNKKYVAVSFERVGYPYYVWCFCSNFFLYVRWLF